MEKRFAKQAGIAAEARFPEEIDTFLSKHRQQSTAARARL